jgi:tetratricopeptide (TPR) repeat protein
MHRIISLEPNFYYSGPYRFFGSLYTRIPGIELSQAKTYFDQAIQANPEYLGNLVSMAEYYHQKSGNREMFNKTLETVLNTDINLYPELMAENFLYQKRARNL